ncbi:MAG TPA: hypothetical protein VG164_06270 [Trebonia sp.]|nr:hypothetical protein [Trebonia sp.]
MKTGAGLALICVGAILAFAVRTNTSVFNIHIAGWVIMLVGIAGLFVPRKSYGWLGRRMLVRRTRAWPGNEQVEEIPVPPYVARNPGTSRMQAGLPPTPSLLNSPQTDPVRTGATGNDQPNGQADQPNGQSGQASQVGQASGGQPQPAPEAQPPGQSGQYKNPASQSPTEPAPQAPGDTEVIEDLYEQ